MSHTQYLETKLLTTIPAPPDLALLKPWVLQLDYSLNISSTILYLGFFKCKLGTITAPTSWAHYGD